MEILNSDLLVQCLKYLSPGNLALCRLVCKRWCEIISVISGRGRAHHFWRSSYLDFVNKVMTLDISYRLLCAQNKWTVDLTLDIARLLAIPKEKRTDKMLVEEGLMTTEQIVTVSKFMKRKAIGWDILLQFNNLLIALRECLVTPEQMESLINIEFCYTYFRREYVIVALREKLITIDQFVAFPMHLSELLRTYRGIILLRENLITIDEIFAFPNSNYVNFLTMNDWGIYALRATNTSADGRKRLITPEQIRAMPNSLYLLYLFNYCGLYALREGLITPEQVAALPSCDCVQFLFMNERGFNALKNGLLTPEQVGKGYFAEGAFGAPL